MTNRELSPEFSAELAALNETVEELQATALTHQVFETAMQFQIASNDPGAGRHLLSARWADYINALQAHAEHFARHHIKETQK